MNMMGFKGLSAPFKILLIMLLGGGILGNSLFAKEPTNWLFGFGIGTGKTQIDRKYTESARNGVGGLLNGAGATFANRYDSSAVSWGVTYEFLVGYKHFLNNYVGFRYYGNVGVQHYKDDYFTEGKIGVGVVDYTLNADILINFYNSESFTFGMLGGFGVGGAYFDSPVLETYERTWGPSSANPGQFAEPEYDDNMQKVKRNHLSASVSVGARFNIFQKIRRVGDRVCSGGADGRRTCRVPISYLEHSIELNAKFPLITYYPTKSADMLGVRTTNNNVTTYNGSFARPGYEVKNPYKFTLRYIIAF